MKVAKLWHPVSICRYVCVCAHRNRDQVKSFFFASFTLFPIFYPRGTTHRPGYLIAVRSVSSARALAGEIVPVIYTTVAIRARVIGAKVHLKEKGEKYSCGRWACSCAIGLYKTLVVVGAWAFVCWWLFDFFLKKIIENIAWSSDCQQT